MLIAIVGAGWNGCHLANELSGLGHRVILLERGSQIFAGTSGAFGIRLHRGPHYPRSKATRLQCQKNFERFREKYADLIVDHEYSIYANGIVDSENFPSKVSDETFHQVCMEYPGCKKLNPAAYAFAEMTSAYDLDEPSVVVGARAREMFEDRLERAGVHTVLGVAVLNIKQRFTNNSSRALMGITVQQTKASSNGEQAPPYTFFADAAINCTGFQQFVPAAVSDPSSPLYFEYTYQVCLALRFRDNAPTSCNPISFICMDGWFPCLMPAVSDADCRSAPHRNYILTHGAYTILGSFGSIDEARQLLYEKLTDEIVAGRVRNPAESEMRRLWPSFSSRFTYDGWYGTVLAKPKCPTEFRSSFAFENAGTIHVFPGKVSNIFDAYDEVAILLKTKGTLSDLVIQHDDCRFVANGVFHNGRTELQEKPTLQDRSTSKLQTLGDI